MTVTDTFLNNTAAALNSETYLTPAYLITSSDATITSIATTDTTFSGEVGSRYALTNSRDNSEVTWVVTRPAADITESTGENLIAVGTMTAATGGFLMTGIVVSGVTQTTNFDVEVSTVIEVARK